jgi:hypothetical protein
MSSEIKSPSLIIAETCWNIANYVAVIVKEDGCNGGLLVAANNHCLMSKFGKFGSHHC